jgi:hypothetical protein
MVILEKVGGIYFERVSTYAGYAIASNNRLTMHFCERKKGGKKGGRGW